MAAAQFPFNGQQYQIDDQGTILEQVNGQWQPVSAADQNNVALNQAAATAQTAGVQPAPAADAAPPAAPAAPATTPPAASGGISAGASVHQTGTTSLVPPDQPSIPTTPPRAGVGSATELRTQRAAVQSQIDQINAIPVDGRTPSQNTLLASLTTRASDLTDQITKAETPKEKPPSTVRPSYASDAEPFVIVDNGDGTITPQANPNYTGQVKPQVVQHGNQTLVITPPTSDELAANKAAPPHVTVAYTDTDAKAIADRQTAVSEANSKTAAAAQATNDFAAHAKADLDARVAAGEDAASIRAEQAQKLQELFQNWQMADGDRKTAQTALDAYNTDRHAQASEKLTQQQIDNTAAQQAAQDATTRRGQDIAAQTSRETAQTQQNTAKYTSDQAAQTARMQVGAQWLQNGLTLLSTINKDLPIGSDLAGKALPGLLAYGQKFLEGIAGPNPTMAGLPTPGGAADVTNPTAPSQAGDITPLQGSGVSPTPIANPVGTSGYQTPSGYQGAPNPNVFGSAPDTIPMPQPAPVAPATTATPGGGLDWLFNSPASPVGNPANTSAQDATTQSLAAQNAQAHQTTMAEQVFGPTTRDGTPLATSADVARAFGRAA